MKIVAIRCGTPFKSGSFPVLEEELGEVDGKHKLFIAAEQLNRRCFGIEIEPAYCDVIVRRWQKFTGRLATLDRTGKSPIPLDAE